jgi:hypothetical protein
MREPPTQRLIKAISKAVSGPMDAGKSSGLGLLLSMLIKMGFCRVARVLVSIHGMRMRQMSMVRRFFVLSALVMFRGFGMMFCGARMVIGGALMMFSKGGANGGCTTLQRRISLRYEAFAVRQFR